MITILLSGESVDPLQSHVRWNWKSSDPLVYFISLVVDGLIFQLGILFLG